MRVASVAIAAVFLLGCSSGRPLSNVPALDTRSDDSPEASNEHAYAYVVFRHLPSHDHDGDEEICRNLTQYLLPRSQAPAGTLTTYWPAKTSITTVSANCDRMMAEYDLDFALNIAKATEVPDDWQVFLMAQAPGPWNGYANCRIFVDLTGNTGDELRGNLVNWQQLMMDGPSKWELTVVDRAKLLISGRRRIVKCPL